MWKFVFAALAAVLVVGLDAMDGLGGFRDLDVNDAGVMDALNFAVTEHNRRSNTPCKSQVGEVVRAQGQVVAGFNYVITVRMRRDPCGTNPNAQIYECNFKVWKKLMREGMALTGEKCG